MSISLLLCRISYGIGKRDLSVPLVLIWDTVFVDDTARNPPMHNRYNCDMQLMWQVSIDEIRIIIISCFVILAYCTRVFIGGSKGGVPETRPPPLSSLIYFILMEISAKILPNNSFWPKLSSWRPLGNPGSVTAVKLPMTKPHSPWRTFYSKVAYSTFSQTHNSSNNGINPNFVFPYICSFLCYLFYMMLLNVVRPRITFEGCRFHWFC